MTSDKKSQITRREMLCRSATIAAPLVIPGSVLGRDGTTAPSNRITVGCIGIGAMGRGHLRICADFQDTQVLAVCDVDSWRRNDGLQTLEQVYRDRRASGQANDVTGHNDFREILERDDIDAVILSPGDRWHPAMTVLAAQAGKDIYCEKPISLTIRQARTMLRAVRRHQVVFQTGLQQRNSAEFLKAVELVHAGRIGEVKRAYVTAGGVNNYLNLPAEPVPEGLDWELWLGPSPWHPYNHRYHHAGRPQHVVPWDCNRAFGGGGLTSGTVHNFDSAQQGLKKDSEGPVKITPPGVDGAHSLTFTYADGAQIIGATRLEPGKHEIPPGWNPQTPIVNFGVLFVGQHGWIHVERRGLLNCYPEHILDVEFPRIHSVAENHRDWIDCIRTRRRPRADVESSAYSTILSHLGCIAMWTGRSLTWEPRQEEFLEDREANSMRARATREPWSV